MQKLLKGRKIEVHYDGNAVEEVEMDSGIGIWVIWGLSSIGESNIVIFCFTNSYNIWRDLLVEFST